jgi:hypothetical protein
LSGYFSPTVSVPSFLLRRTRLLSVFLPDLSNGEAYKSDIILSKSHLRKYFDNIISAEEVRKYKPSPGPYLLSIFVLILVITHTLKIHNIYLRADPMA